MVVTEVVKLLGSAVQKVLPAPGDDWWYGHTGSSTSSGEQIDEQTALTCAAVYAACRVLSETVACVPLAVYERLPTGGKRPATDHPMYRVLHDEPNPETSSYLFREAAQGHLCTWGNAYAEIERTRRGQPLRLWLLPPDRMQVFRDATTKQIWYKYRTDGAEPRYIPVRDMLHIPGFSFDGLVGYSPVSLMVEAIGMTKARERYAAEVFQNDARPSGFIQHPGRLGDKAYKRLEASIAGTGSAHGQRHRLRILEEGMQFAATSMKPGDVQMIETARFGIEEIARAYRIAPHLLQDLTHGTYSNITRLGQEFIVYTMMPWFRRWQGEVNRKLLTPPYFCEFNAHAFLQGDHKARAEYYQKLFGIGGMTINRILELENENPIGPDGDVRFVPGNMVTLERAIEGPPEPAAGFPRGDEGEDEEEDKPEPSQKKPKEDEEQQQSAAMAFFVDAQKRMLRKEANAAKRWAKEPDRFVARLEAFYEKHEATCRDAFGPAVEAGFRPYGNTSDAERTVGLLVWGHIRDSRDSLLQAAECQRDDLVDRVAACTADWMHPRPYAKEIVKDALV